MGKRRWGCGLWLSVVSTDIGVVVVRTIESSVETFNVEAYSKLPMS